MRPSYMEAYNIVMHVVLQYRPLSHDCDNSMELVTCQGTAKVIVWKTPPRKSFRLRLEFFRGIIRWRWPFLGGLYWGLVF